MRQNRAFGSDAFGNGIKLFRARHIAAAAVFMTMSTGCSMPTGATSDSVEFLCTVDGVELLGSSANAASVCATFKQQIDEALPRATKLVKSASGADWIKVDIRFAKPAGATALVTRKDVKGEHVYPVIGVDVMDKAFGDREVNILAGEVAKLVSGRG